MVKNPRLGLRRCVTALSFVRLRHEFSGFTLLLIARAACKCLEGSITRATYELLTYFMNYRATFIIKTGIMK